MSASNSNDETRSISRQQTTDDESDPEFINKAPYTYEKKERKRPRKNTSSPKGLNDPKGKRYLQDGKSFLDMFFGPVLNLKNTTHIKDESQSDESDDLSEEQSYSSSQEEGPSDWRRDKSGSILRQHDYTNQKNKKDTTKYINTQSLLPRSSSPLSNLILDEEESETESDSGEENMFKDHLIEGLSKTQKMFLGTNNPKGNTLKALTDHEDSGSETESDSEYESEDPFDLSPRPMFKRDESFSSEAYSLDSTSDVRIPGPINGFLRKYQRDGIQFFYDRYKEGRGGVLGDDMGLGKTVQVIAFLSAIMRKYNDRRDLGRRYKHVSSLQDGYDWKKNRRLPPANATWPTCLIIAPSSVVPNWERELSTWGYFETGMYIGIREERKEVLKNFTMGRLDVLVTSFDLARRDREDLFHLPFSVVFVDEAHRLKNPSSNLTVSFNEISCDIRFGLTGTAIQNSYDELWTLLNWTNPGRVGSLKEWRSCISKPLAIGQSTKANEDERALSKAVARTLVEQLLPKLFLRRTKDLIRDQLPQKIDQVVFCPLAPQQLKVYRRILDYRIKCLKAKGDGPQSLDSTPCDCGSEVPRRKCCHSMEDVHFFTYLTVLLKISNHVALILPDSADTNDQVKRNREVSKIAFDDYKAIRYGRATLSSDYCGKWDVLNSLLKAWKEEKTDKVLVFTKSVKLLDILDFHLQKNSYNFCRLDGSTKLSERMKLIDKFNQDPDVFIFLISTMAGGTGLNLTSANKVVIFDPNWNPAHDLQAMDRAYRFGQTRDVHVYRLLGAGSIEENIYARQIYKQQMMKIGYEASHQTRYFEGVQGDSKRKGELFGLDNLFTLQEDEMTTKMAIEKANLAEFDWAMANMESGFKQNKNTPQSKEARLLEAEADKELRGLATLFLDEDAPSVQVSDTSDEINKILGKQGIKYSHQNDHLLRPSRVEEMSLQEAVKKIKKRRVSTTGPRNNKRRRQTYTPEEPSSPEPDPNWPPKRGHHKPTLSPDSREKARKKALIDLGYIKSDDDYPQFANKFTAMSPEKQREILAKLDRHIRTIT